MDALGPSGGLVALVRQGGGRPRAGAAVERPGPPATGEHAAAVRQEGDHRDREATYAALTALLATLAAEHRARALPAEGEAALLWASLAAFSSTMATRLSVGFAKRGDDDTEPPPT